MMDAPLVSVYLPTRNRRALLERAVGSVLEQTYPKVELIVANDGSTDGTADWLDREAGRDSRLIPIHHTAAQGAPRARNAAIRAARGEFVTGLDDDDYFHRERIERLVAHWRSLEAAKKDFSSLFTLDIAIGDGPERIIRKPARVSCDDLYFYNTIGNQIFTRRAWFMEAGMFDEAMPAWQDLDAFIRVLRHFGPAELLNEPLYFLSLEPRHDRISVGSKERILAAYRRLAQKPHASPLLRQGLLLQVFGRLYGFRPTGADLAEFFRHGLHLRTMRMLAQVLMRTAMRQS